MCLISGRLRGEGFRCNFSLLRKRLEVISVKAEGVTIHVKRSTLKRAIKVSWCVCLFVYLFFSNFNFIFGVLFWYLGICLDAQIDVILSHLFPIIEKFKYGP